MRVVLDTNVLISAFFWDGKERGVLLTCRNKMHQSITSPSILEELERVLSGKFDVPKEELAEYTRSILVMSEVVLTTGVIDVVKEDPDDNVILETAVLGLADAIITGDRHLLKLNPYKEIKIVHASKFK